MVMFDKSSMTTKLVDVSRAIPTSQGPKTSWLTIDESSLVVVDGPHKGLEFPLDRELVRIGRGEWCDLVLSQDELVSSEHCECWLEERGVRIRDSNSRNGTLLNDCPVVDAYIVEGAQVKLGHSLLELRSHRKQTSIPISFQDQSGLLVGKSRSMRKIFSMLQRLGQRDVSTLLTGETGTGKSSIARAIHEQSSRANGPFVTVNCGSLPAGLIESELFGYAQGAFTGATASRQGFFQQAHGGTLFLDEIAELPLKLQPKLLDVIERKKVRPLGSEKDLDVDFRLLAATHRDLSKEIQERRFREDLFFRLSVVTLEVPPLRERSEDIPLLVERLLAELVAEQFVSVEPAAMASLRTHLWPGNIRELRNVLERAIVFLDDHLIRKDALGLSGDVEEESLSTPSNVTPLPNMMRHLEQGSSRGTAPTNGVSAVEEFPLAVREIAQKSQRVFERETQPASGEEVSLGEAIRLAFSQSLQSAPISLCDTTAAFEKALVIKALKETDNNVRKASEMLGISQAWLYNRIKKYNLKKRRGQ